VHSCYLVRYDKNADVYNDISQIREEIENNEKREAEQHLHRNNIANYEQNNDNNNTQVESAPDQHQQPCSEEPNTKYVNNILW